MNVSRVEPAGALFASPTPATGIGGLKLRANFRSRVRLELELAPAAFAMFLVRHAGQAEEGLQA